jgi:hypothetical protein
MPSGLIVLIAELATDNDAALEVLLRAGEASDGWVAEKLETSLSAIERRDPERVRRLKSRLQ